MKEFDEVKALYFIDDKVYKIRKDDHALLTPGTLVFDYRKEMYVLLETGEDVMTYSFTAPEYLAIFEQIL